MIVTSVDNVTPDPSLPLLLPSAGVPGYSGRVLVAGVTGNDGDAVATIPAFDGAGALAPTRNLNGAAGTGKPTLRVLGTDKFVTSDAVDDLLTGAATVTAWKTTALVLRNNSSPAGSAGLANLSSGIVLSKSSTNFTANFGTGGGGAQITCGGMTSDLWHVIVVVQNGASSFVKVDTTTATGTLGTNVPTRLQLFTTASNFGSYSFAEAVTWDGALTTGQADTVIAALKASHPLLFP